MAFAHVDFLGDVHPSIEKTERDFIVHFSNNGERTSYRTTVSADGRVSSPRELEKDARQPGRGENFERKFGAFTYRFSRWQRDDEAKRTYQVCHPKGERTLLLPKVVTSFQRMEDIVPTEDGFVVLTRRESNTLRLVHLLREGDSTQEAVVGDPQYIYDFPMTSGVAMIESTAYVAWISDGDDMLHLSSWAVGSGGKATTLDLATTSGNTSIDISAQGRNLLIAFHALDGGKPGVRIRLFYCVAGTAPIPTCRQLRAY